MNQPMTGTLIEDLTSIVQKVEHSHKCMQCGGKLECDPTDCIADENLICASCDWMQGR